MIQLWRSVIVSLAFVLILRVINAAEPQTPIAKAEQTYRTNRVRFQNDHANVQAAWQFARACFDLAEFAANDEQREGIAKQGIDAARRSLAHRPESVEAHFYLALNLGQLARTKRLGALKIVHEMEREFKTAIQLDEQFDHAAPRRSLGLLYRDAPGWPTSIGSRSKARRELERAVELSPNYPENRLCLAESYAEWGEKRALQAEVQALAELLPKARKSLSGEDWAEDWRDWDTRWEKLRQSAEKSSKRVP